jgi:hypothetical protein
VVLLALARFFETKGTHIMADCPQYQISFADMGLIWSPNGYNTVGISDALHSDEINHKGNFCIHNWVYPRCLCQEGFCSECEHWQGRKREALQSKSSSLS